MADCAYNVFTSMTWRVYKSFPAAAHGKLENAAWLWPEIRGNRIDGQLGVLDADIESQEIPSLQE